MADNSVTGLLCVLLRRFIEAEEPDLNFDSVCDEVACACRGKGLSAAHRVGLPTFLALTGRLAELTGRSPGQLFEDWGRTVAAMLRSSYPDVFRTALSVEQIVETAASVSYSLLFPTLSEEAAQTLWHSRVKNSELKFVAVTNRTCTSYLRGFVEGAAAIFNEPVSVRVVPNGDNYDFILVASRPPSPPDGTHQRR